MPTHICTYIYINMYMYISPRHMIINTILGREDHDLRNKFRPLQSLLDVPAVSFAAPVDQ